MDKIIARSVTLYASEKWTRQPKHDSRLNAIEITYLIGIKKCDRIFGRKFDRSLIGALINELSQLSISDTVEDNPSCNGHICHK